MKLEQRLAKLEALKAQAAASDNGHTHDLLWDKLVGAAHRLQDAYPDEAWCQSASPIGIAAMLLLTKVGGETTPALEERVRELSTKDNPTAKLIKALEGMTCAT